MAESMKPPTLSSLLLLLLLLVITVVPILASFLFYHFHQFDAAAIPDIGFVWRSPGSVPNHHDHILQFIETIGQEGSLPGPEDLAYDPHSKLIYASCHDGWIKRVKHFDSDSDSDSDSNFDSDSNSASDFGVENWVWVGGRPLGIAVGPGKELFVAEANKGLLKVTREGEIAMLTSEAQGLKFGLADGIDVAEDGVIYFTDASHKYDINNFLFDFLEGRPYGRLLSFNPSTNKTQLLLQDLYFPNGVALSPKQDFLVYCETILRTCTKYYIKGDKKGTTELYVDRLPGYPDNIKYDGNANFLIGFGSGRTLFWDTVFKYPSLRKLIVMLLPYVKIPKVTKDGGVVAVNLEGELTALYTDHALTGVTSGIKIGNHLYYGSLTAGYISRIKLASFDGSNV